MNNQAVIGKKWFAKLAALLIITALVTSVFAFNIGKAMAAPADIVVTLQNERTDLTADLQIEVGASRSYQISYLNQAKSFTPELATVTYKASEPGSVNINGSMSVTGAKAGVAYIAMGNRYGVLTAFQFLITDSNNISAYRIKEGGELFLAAVGTTVGSPVEIPAGSGLFSRITWSSTNESVATVAANGSITAKATGNAIIIGKFTDKWGVPRDLHILVGVGTGIGGPTVTGVTVSPGEPIAVGRDGYELFSATVQGTGKILQSVTWRVLDTKHSGVTITDGGLLYVPRSGLVFTNPEDDYVTVRAASVNDPSVYQDVKVLINVAYLLPKFFISQPVEPIEVSVGGEMPCRATEAGTNANITQIVTWEVFNNNSSSTTISSSGTLSIAKNETAKYIVIRATYDLQQSGKYYRYTRINLKPLTL